MQSLQRSLARGAGLALAFRKSRAQFPLADLFALLFVLSMFPGESQAQATPVPNTAAMGQALSANITGTYTAPPNNLVSASVTGGMVTGNGDMAIIVGGASSALKFYVGKADFWGVLRGAIMPVGSLTLSTPALSGSSYSLNQNVGAATVTGNFVNGSSSLSVTSWVASSENTAVIELKNSGSQPLVLISQLLDGLASSAGNPATYGSTNNSTWLNVSPDSVYVELGNQMHNSLGTAPFTGKIADLRLYNQALSGATLAALDNAGAPTPLLRWSTTNAGTATLVGTGASLNASDSHGGSVVLTGDSGSELAVGDLPLPENQFTFSTWINVSSTGVNGNIVTAQIPFYPEYGYPYPYPRGLTLKLVNGSLTASLNQSGAYNPSNDEFNADAVNKFSTSAASPIPANQWVQTAVTYDGNVLTIYTNGVQAGVTASFPTGTNGMQGWNKLAVHIGDTNMPYNACAPQGVLMQSVVGATATTNSQGALSFTIPAGGQASIVLAAVTDRNNTNYFSAAQQQSMKATADSLTTLRQTHDAFWTNFWSKSFVQIPDQTIQNGWYAGLYLLACCSGTNSPPPGLWGNFNTSTQPEWLGDYTLNYNYESPFLGALACNHTELADSYDTPLLDQMGRGSAAAQANFGGNNNGLYFLCHIIPFPGASDDIFAFEGMKSSSVFAAVDMAQRWKYTLDTNYAAKVYPYLKGVADFWDNYLVLTNGVYMDDNDSWSEFTGNDTNPTMTLAFINLVYPALIQMSQALNLDAGSRAQWSNVVANLSPLPIVPASSIPSLNALGAPYNNPGVNVLRATSSGGAFYPNPAVTLYQDHAIRSNVGQGPMTAIYPGWNIGLESPSYSLLAASNTVWLTGDWYDYNADNFSYPSAACIGFDPNQILTNLDTFLSLYSYNNFMIDAGGGGTEQYSTVPGTLAAMFVQSYQTNMHIFPDWPTNQSAAFGNLNACGGFLVSSAITLGKPNYIQIQSTAGQMLKLVNPWSNSTVQCVSSINGTTNLSGAILDYQTQVGEVLTLTTTNAALSAPTSAAVFTNGNSLVLNWNPVSGAAGYNVKRSTSPNGPFTDLASVTSATSYTDASVGYSTTYYYEITALEPGYESTNSIVLTATSGAKPPILNNSFELQNIGEGNYLLGDPTDWSSLLLSGTADAVISPGPSGTSEPWPTIPVPGLDGTNFCQIYASAVGGGGLVYQDTGIKYQAGISYILTAAFGLQNSQTFAPGSSFGFYNSSLTPVAWTTINTNSLTKGAFVGNAVNYTATGNEGGNGDIVIGFNMPAAASAQSYFDFDDVLLSVTNTTPPVITSEPVSQTVALGTNATFSVGATGTGLNYQWYFDTNTAILRATNATLPLTNVQSHGTYDVVVSNTAGSLTSSIVGLTVAPGPLTLLDAQFGNNAIQTGAAVLGSAGDLWNSVTGSTANLFNAAGTSLSGAALTLSCQGTFSDTNGSAMDVATTPLMEEYAYGYTAPANVRVSLTGLSTYEGDTFTLIVYGAGDGSGQGATLNLTGATGGNATNTLTTTATSRQISLGNGIAYQTFTGTLTNGTLGITASIPSGGTFAIVNGLQLQLVPQTLFITTQPVSESTNAGNSVFFNVDATGTAPSYQWYFDTNTPISGGTNATLSLTNVRTSGTYDVTVSNAYGSLTSSIAKLTVLPNAPSTMTATPGVNEVTLTYGAVANAKFYVIYRSKVSGGSYTKIATTTATKYTDHNVIAGTTYFYVVIVCDGVNLSAYSQQVSGKPNR